MIWVNIKKKSTAIFPGTPKAFAPISEKLSLNFSLISINLIAVNIVRPQLSNKATDINPHPPV